MNARFADSYYYFALLVADDYGHDAAIRFTDESMGLIVTTPWIITEVTDGLSAPANRQLFLDLIESLDSDPDVVIVPADEHLFREGIALFASRLDKDWSLTDCISFRVMQMMGIHEALTGDHHFEQAGFTALLK